MPTIDWIMKLLEDGNWHTLGEIMEKSQLPNSKIEAIVNFLSKYNLVSLDKGLQKVKLTPKTLHFLKRIREGEKGQIKYQ